MNVEILQKSLQVFEKAWELDYITSDVLLAIQAMRKEILDYKKNYGFDAANDRSAHDPCNPCMAVSRARWSDPLDTRANSGIQKTAIR